MTCGMILICSIWSARFAFVRAFGSVPGGGTGMAARMASRVRTGISWKTAMA